MERTLHNWCLTDDFLITDTLILRLTDIVAVQRGVHPCELFFQLANTYNTSLTCATPKEAEALWKALCSHYQPRIAQEVAEAQREAMLAEVAQVRAEMAALRTKKG